MLRFSINLEKHMINVPSDESSELTYFKYGYLTTIF